MNLTEPSVDCNCQGVFPSDPVTQIIVASINFVLVAIVLWASYHVDKKDLCRMMYTLWLYLSHVPFDLAMLIISPLQMKGIVDNSGRLYEDRMNLVPIIGKIFQDIASQVYRVLALLMVVITYTSYRFPFFYHKVFNQSRRSMVFLSGFIFILVEVLASNFITLTAMETWSPTWDIIATIIFYFLQLFGTLPIVFVIVLYVASIISIVSYAKTKAQRGESNKNQRRQLISVIIYSTSPNILLLPLFLGNILLIIQINDEKLFNSTLVGVLVNTANIMRYCNYIRIPVITISTFAAFAPYRAVLMSGKRRRGDTTRVVTISRIGPSSVSTARSNNAQSAVR
uniref:G protein-coupled receptor n=1 Tax=Steinernema glaseri TaxID=37863 RepID=A0A1I7ZD56_9BILA